VMPWYGGIPCYNMTPTDTGKLLTVAIY